jgi:hypothetical protein
MSDSKPSFLKDHADTVAIIGVNVAIAAILVSMWISNSHRVDAANARSDALYAQLMSQNDKFYELLKERK